MAVKPIPEGYHSVTPYLVVPAAAKVLEFLSAAFGAKQAFPPFKTPDGKIGHAEVRIGDSTVMLADASAEYPALTAMLHLYVPDVDATYQRALAAGGVSEREPANQFYGDRSAAVRDPGGNHWYVATHVEDVPPEEMERRARDAAKKK